MASITDDPDDEYLDDPISLLAIDDIKKEICDEDQIIDINSSSDEEEIYTSAYGKKNFVLPVTFFDNTRNIRLLNKCKPMSINIVDCKHYPTYYSKNGEKSISKSDESSVETDNKDRSDSVNNPKSADAQNVISSKITVHVADSKEEGEKKDAQNVISTSIKVPEADSKEEGEKKHARNVISTSIKVPEADSKEEGEKKHARNVISTSITVPGADSKQEGEKKRVRKSHCHSFYDKLKRRKENSKQRALHCKDLSQVDFKRNTGLVGLKITDTVFKQIVNTEKTMIRTKKDQAENKSKESNENGAEKQLITEKTDAAPTEKFRKKFECVVENALSVIFGNKLKENKQSETEKEPVVTKSTDCTKDKKKKSENAVYGSFVENRCKDNTEKYGEKKLSSTNITSAKDKTKDSNTYIKKIGATLDDLGTIIIPVTDTHTNNVVSNNVTVTEMIENKSIRTHKNSADFVDKLGDNHDIAMRCSLKVPSKKIVEKVLKLKEVKSQCKSPLDISQNTIVQQSLKETINKSQTVSQFNIKCYKRNKDGSFVISEKDKLQCKGIDKVAYSRETKQVEKPKSKYASKKNQRGSNSPVIPCTTITVRAGPPKSSQNIPSTKDTVQSPRQDTSSTVHITSPAKSMKHFLPQVNIDKPSSTSNDAQKLSQSPKIAMLNQADVSSECKYRVTSKQLPVVTQTSVQASSDKKATSVCTQNSKSNIKSLKITEYKPPSCYPLAASQIDIKNSVSVPNWTDQNMTKTNLTKETNQVNTPIKSASFSGNAVQINNQTTNGLIRNQTYPNPQMSPSSNPKFSGHNAIIFRRPPPPPSRDSPNHAPPNQGQHIQTLINYRPQYQPMPNGSTLIRFRLPPPYPPPPYPPPPYPPPPPNYPPPPPNYSSPPSSLAQVRPNQIFIPPSRMRAIGMGLHNLWLPGPRPSSCRPPLPIPPIQRQNNLQMNLRPPTPHVNKDSSIGNNANGDPIKKINIPPPPPPPRQTTDTVNDKKMMLAELNNAMMSPDLTTNKPEEKPIGDLKRKADPKPIKPVKPKYSKPCPLSKKSNVATDLNTKVPDKPVPTVEYSPPILPIWTYEESFQLFSQNDTYIKKGVPNNGTQNHTRSKTKCRANIIKLGSKNKKRTHRDSGKQDKAKKISFEDYRKRAKDGADRIDVDKIRRHNKSKNVTDDNNQDLGYDSDSTVKL